MTVATIALTESAKTLIDSRLDTIDRMLLGRVPRGDRLAIVKDVEAQIHEHLQESDGEEHDREHVLAVLARLDPPEAFLPEENDPLEVAPTRITVAPRSTRYGRKEVEPTIGRVSGILGICAVASLLLYPLSYLSAMVIENELVIFLGWGLAFLVGFVGGILGLALGICARPKGPWSVVGMVTSGLAVALSLAAGMGVLLMFMAS